MRKRVSEMSLSELMMEVERIDDNRMSLVEDPMTAAMGAPVGDFMEEWDGDERAALGRILELAPEGSEEREFALGRFEKWMP